MVAAKIANLEGEGRPSLNAQIGCANWRDFPRQRRRYAECRAPQFSARPRSFGILFNLARGNSHDMNSVADYVGRDVPIIVEIEEAALLASSL
jgi:hypothetical protein